MKLRIIPTAEGYFDAITNQYIYNYKDHLGNVRLSYTDTNKDGVIQPRRYFVRECDGPWDPFNQPNCIDTWKPGEIVEVNNYYPFGLMHNYTATTQNAYQYKYNGKELQETGQYDYGARFYMPDIGRWGVIDPLAEKYRRMSPYTYAGNNPAIFVDYDGRDYGLYIDFKTGTITVKATYYATSNDMKSANQAVKMWNDMSGKYNYSYRDGNGNKLSMKVKFELQTSEVAVGKGEKRLDVLNKAMESATKGEGNIYRVAASKDMSPDDNGSTAGGNSIRVVDSRAGTETGAHEVGHSLGADHKSSGILTSSADDQNRSNYIISSNISDILGGFIGNPSDPSKAKETNGGLGKATIHLESNNLETDKDYKKFRNGSLQATE